MTEKVVPMIHVPNVRDTVAWYERIGFTVIAAYGDEGDGLSFAMLRFGATEVMFTSGGHPSSGDRREVDLYIYTNNVEDLYHQHKDRVEVIEGLHDSFYGMREFIIRDLNRFWITFGQPSVFDLLMTAIREGNSEGVRELLERGGLKPETLTSALAAAASVDQKSDQILELLENAGAVAPFAVDLTNAAVVRGSVPGRRGNCVQRRLQGRQALRSARQSAAVHFAGSRPDHLHTHLSRQLRNHQFHCRSRRKNLLCGYPGRAHDETAARRGNQIILTSKIKRLNRAIATPRP